MILILSKYKSLQKSLLQTWREGLQACSDTEPGLSHQQKALAWGGARPSRNRNTHHFLEVTQSGLDNGTTKWKKATDYWWGQRNMAVFRIKGQRQGKVSSSRTLVQAGQT